MKKKGLQVVYMHPKEKPIAWVGMLMLLNGSPRASSRPRVRQRLELDQVGEVAGGQLRLRPREHGGAAHRRATWCSALQLTNPRAVGLPNAYLDRDIPQPGALREDVGTGESLLTRTGSRGDMAVEGEAGPLPARLPRRRRLRLDLTTPACSGCRSPGSPSSSSCRS